MAGSDETKKKLLWIYQLRKEEILTELRNREIPANETSKLDELRRILKTAVQAKQRTDEKQKLNEENSNEAGADENGSNAKTIKEDEPKMEYSTQLDFKIGVDD